MIDVHCHLDDPRLEGYVPEDDLIVITMGTDVKSSEKAVELADKYPNVWACVGIHPENAIDELGNVIYELKKLTKHPKVVGIGEVGLDYRQEIKPEEKEKQRELFEEMVKLSHETNLPMVVHNRNADEDIYSSLKSQVTSLKGILMHCFTRNAEFLKKMIYLGAYFSFGGMITYDNNSRMRNVACLVPDDKLLLETDAPYSVPVGGKGDINTPANVKIVAKVIAELKNIPVEKLEKITDANSKRLFIKMT
jgi:TatD DNase family protein